MRAPSPAKSAAPQAKGRGLIWDLLTFDKLMTGPLVHLVYWAGLALIAFGGFALVGAGVGVAIRDGSLEGALVAVPVLVAGLLGIAVAIMLWRGACEYYLATLRISEDLREIRIAMSKGEIPKPPLGDLAP